MKTIDKLLKKANIYLANAASRARGIFADNLDGFIVALGLDPDKFKIERYGEVVGYDEIAALNEVAKEVWDAKNC